MHKILLVILFCTTSIIGAEKIFVNNQVLARVHGKAITVLDVAKKMDVMLLRFKPETYKVTDERLAFYQSQWKSVLMELIDQELVLQSAEEVQMPVTPGDIRQELEEVFGPEVCMNIEQTGMTYEEAWDMAKADILIRRMLYWQITMQAQAEVRPEEIHAKYDAYVKDTTAHALYTYRFATFKSNELQKAIAMAELAHKQLAAGKTFADLGTTIHDQLQKNGVTFTVSDRVTQNIDEMAGAVIAGVTDLHEGAYSAPKAAQSRTDKTTSIRIYALEKKEEHAPKPFEEAAEDLKRGIIEERYGQYSKKYFAKLRKEFHVDEEAIFAQFSPEFQPFR